MFGELFIKECRQVLKCTTYYVLIFCMILFFAAQFSDLGMLQKPQPGQKDYGMTTSKDEAVIMDKAFKTMVREYENNKYSAYPIGFYKEVTLSKAKQAKMAEIIGKLTGLSGSELTAALETYGSRPATMEELKLILMDDMTYDRFKGLMKQADKLIGGGSNYSNAFLRSNAWVPMTYEDALQNYNDIIQKDHLSGAYARLFSDYLGIILTILPVFLAVTRGLRDKRARAGQVIYIRKASSLQIILSRYLSMVIMILLPVLVIGGMLTVQCIYNGSREGVSIDDLAFLKYSLGWLLPAIMISASLGVLLTELTETAIAILVMGFWWFISLLMGIASIEGGYGWNLIPRHNTLGGFQVYHDNFGILAVNRITYATAAVLLVIAAAYVYDLKRKGRLIIRGKVSSNRKNKSEV